MPKTPAKDAKSRGGVVTRQAGRRVMTDVEKERIRQLIRTWPIAPMTWDLVCERVAREIQQVGRSKTKTRGSDANGWSRQALSRHESIQKAFDDRKQELAAEAGRLKKDPNRNRDPEVVVLRRERVGLRIKISELEAQLAAYEERFQMILYNRSLGAQTEAEMTQPLLPKIDRLGRTE